MTETPERMLPLYEAKMLHIFDHRWATYEGGGATRDVRPAEKDDPDFEPIPRYWVAERTVLAQLPDSWVHPWLLGWRRVARSTDERTSIFSRSPIAAIPDKFALALSEESSAPLQALFSSFALDYVLRQKIAGTQVDMFVVKQLPVIEPRAVGSLSWSAHSEHWFTSRIVELVYTSRSLRPFAEEFGDVGDPFRWDPERRAMIRAELDAAFFHLYGVVRDDVDYIMETFPIVRRKDEAAYGEYRTKRLILEVYGAMQRAMDTGTEYQTILDPPPGQGPRHPARGSD